MLSRVDDPACAMSVISLQQFQNDELVPRPAPRPETPRSPLSENDGLDMPIGSLGPHDGSPKNMFVSTTTLAEGTPHLMEDVPAGGRVR